MRLFNIIKNDKPSARIPYESIYCPHCKKELNNYSYNNKIYMVCSTYEKCNYYYILQNPILNNEEKN